VGYALAVALGHCDAMMGCARGVAAGQGKEVGGLHMGKRDGAMQAVARRKKTWKKRKERKAEWASWAAIGLHMGKERREKEKGRVSRLLGQPLLEKEKWRRAILVYIKPF
jgi:hypothetical protein